MQSYSPQSTQQRATQAYKTSSYHGRSEAELMTEVFGRLIKQLYQAQDAYLARTLDVMITHNAKTMHILDVLREELLASDAFKDEEANIPAKFLLNVYTQVITRLSNVLATPVPKDEFAAIIDLLTPVYRAWQAAAPATPVPDSVTATEPHGAV